MTQLLSRRQPPCHVVCRSERSPVKLIIRFGIFTHVQLYKYYIYIIDIQKIYVHPLIYSLSSLISVFPNNKYKYKIK